MKLQYRIVNQQGHVVNYKKKMETRTPQLKVEFGWVYNFLGSLLHELLFHGEMYLE